MLKKYDDIEPVSDAVLKNVENQIGLKFDEMYFRDLVCPNKHSYTFYQFILDAQREHGDVIHRLISRESTSGDVVIGVNNIHPHYCHTCGELVNSENYHFTNVKRVSARAKECAYIGFPYGCIRF